VPAFRRSYSIARAPFFELRKVEGISKLTIPVPLQFEIPGRNSPLAVQELQIGGTWGWPDYDEQIIARAGARVQSQAHLWFPTPSGMPTRTLPELFKSEARRGGQRAKKRAAVSGGFKVDNREASNRVDRSHSVSKEDSVSHI
jgi:hypothetical protein